MKTIFLAADHGGFLLKEEIREFLKVKGYDVQDLGTNTADSVDYPEFGKKVAENVVQNPESLGICVCGSGIGIGMAANKVENARCVTANSMELVKLGRQHNGANILALGERTAWIDAWEDVVMAFLETEIDDSDRHVRRRCQLG